MPGVWTSCAVSIESGKYHAIDVKPPKGKTCDNCHIVMIASISIKDPKNNTMLGAISTIDGDKKLADTQGPNSFIDVIKGASAPYFNSPAQKMPESLTIPPTIMDSDGETFYDAPTTAVGFFEGRGHGTYIATYSFRFYVICDSKWVGSAKGVSFDLTQAIVVKDGKGTFTNSVGKMTNSPQMTNDDQALLKGYKPK